MPTSAPDARFISASRGVPKSFQDAPAQRNQFRIVAVARIRALEVKFRFDAGRPLAQYDNARRQQQGFFHVVGDENGGEAGVCQSATSSVCKPNLVNESSLASGSSSSKRPGSLTKARANAARCAMPPDS